MAEHPTEINGWESSLPQLAQEIHRLRYDRVEEFYRHAAEELRRQAKNDRSKGRAKLAALLEEAARLAEYQQEGFAEIYALCKPHMTEGESS